MQVPATIKQQVQTKINECIAVAEKHYGITVKQPTIVYNKRGTTAGTANYGTWVIDLNPVLLTENVDNFIARTVPHELSHLITHIVHPHAHRRGWNVKRSVHGAEWQNVMRVLGADPKRCHSYDVSNVKIHKTTTEHNYVCSGCNQVMPMGPKRHAKMQMNPKAYTHAQCGRSSRLVYQGSTAVKPVTAVSASVQPKQPSTPVKTSKLGRCYEMYKQYGTVYSRAQMINIFVQNCDCTPAGASTYYQTCKRNYEAGV